MAKKNQEPTYESDLEAVAAQVIDGFMSVDRAVAEILDNWDVEEAAVQAAIEQQVEVAKAEAAAKAEEEAKKAEEAAKKEEAKKTKKEEKKDTVTVTVPKAFKLRLDHNTELKFDAGIQEMDPKVANHWFAKANGVEIYQPK